MGTLASELAPHAARISPRPRVYADANVPARLVAHMRQALDWDVFFVMEEADLRRASDLTHFRLAAQLRRTLITLDRDYLDSRRFPPGEGSGVLVLSAPDDRQFIQLLTRIDRVLFDSSGTCRSALPLEGRTLQVHTDWRRDVS
ncbi:MAG: DUF5615 family PIN-like protein [Vicinamibacterales bacterium]